MDWGGGRRGERDSHFLDSTQLRDVGAFSSRTIWPPWTGIPTIRGDPSLWTELVGWLVDWLALHAKAKSIRQKRTLGRKSCAGVSQCRNREQGRLIHQPNRHQLHIPWDEMVSSGWDAQSQHFMLAIYGTAIMSVLIKKPCLKCNHLVCL